MIDPIHVPADDWLSPFCRLWLVAAPCALQSRLQPTKWKGMMTFIGCGMEQHMQLLLQKCGLISYAYVYSSSLRDWQTSFNLWPCSVVNGNEKAPFLLVLWNRWRHSQFEPDFIRTSRIARSRIYFRTNEMSRGNEVGPRPQTIAQLPAGGILTAELYQDQQRRQKSLTRSQHRHSLSHKNQKPKHKTQTHYID